MVIKPMLMGFEVEYSMASPRTRGQRLHAWLLEAIHRDRGAVD